MLTKFKFLLFEIKGDIISCKNRAVGLIGMPLYNKKFLLIGITIVFIITLFRSTTKADFYIYFLEILLISFLTFIIFVLSDTFWFVAKKAIIYRIQIKIRKNILLLLKRTREEQIGNDGKNPNAQIYLISYYNSIGFKHNLKRVGVEISILLFLVYLISPLFFVFNLSLFCMMFFYLNFYERQATDQAFWAITNLVGCVDKLYREDPKNCKKFIYENTTPSVRELSVIYQVVKNNKL